MTPALRQLEESIYNKYKYDNFSFEEKKYIDKQLKKYIIQQFIKNKKLFAIFEFNKFNKLESFNINFHNDKYLYFDKEFIIEKIMEIMKENQKSFIIDDIKYWLKSNTIKVFLVQ